MRPTHVLVTGIQAAGKSTVGRLLAKRFERGAFVEGDLLWKMVVSGREDMTPEPSDEAVRQLHLRYRHGAMLASSFARDGFTAVHADIVMGDDLTRYLGWVDHRPLAVVVLTPDVETVVRREVERGTSAYEGWGGSVEDAVRTFQGWIEETPDIGIRVDSTDQTPEETVDEILDRWDEAQV